MKFPKPTKRVKARKPLRRSQPMRKGRSRRVDRKSQEERFFTSWIHSRPCKAIGVAFHVCEGPIQQAHFRDMTGLGLKSSDLLSLPLCRSAHTDYDQGKGIFASHGKVGRKHWFYARVIEVHADFALEHGRFPEGEHAGALL